MLTDIVQIWNVEANVNICFRIRWSRTEQLINTERYDV